MTVVHDFATSLARSHRQADDDWWLAIYRKAFPGVLSAVSIKKDGWAQRGGVDRIITLSSGRIIEIDEKVREKDWDDIALERWSDRDRKTPGWVQKQLKCEFIAYAFLPSRTCYLFPTLTLQRAWKLFGPDWIRDYPSVKAFNDGYVTESVAVPIDVLRNAMGDAMMVEHR